MEKSSRRTNLVWRFIKDLTFSTSRELSSRVEGSSMKTAIVPLKRTNQKSDKTVPSMVVINVICFFSNHVFWEHEWYHRIQREISNKKLPKIEILYDYSCFHQ